MALALGHCSLARIENIYFTAASHGKPYRLLAVSRLHIDHSIVAIPPWAV